jgi:hypothetical protein
MSDLFLTLLHDGMKDKHQKHVTTSLTLIDVHDIARSCRTFEVKKFFIAHSSAAMRSFARTLKRHWTQGYGSSYNPDRKEAFSRTEIVPAFNEVLHLIELETGLRPITIATSALPGGTRISFSEARELRSTSQNPLLLMFGTGWGMAEELISQADYFLEPIQGCGDYNHLSVRSAAAIILDRLSSS